LGIVYQKQERMNPQTTEQLISPYFFEKKFVIYDLQQKNWEGRKLKSTRNSENKKGETFTCLFC